MLDQSSKPFINTRLTLAVTLLETLLNIHTSGWLHKELRSDNIILIRNADYANSASHNDLSTYSVYIAGYFSSRVDRPGEMMERLKSEPEAELYRHQSLLCDARLSYRKSIDIFSAGCTLLEIGLWSSLWQILEDNSAIRAESAASRLVANWPLDRRKAFKEANKETDGERTEPPVDLMKLKHELLLSHFTIQTTEPAEIATRKSSFAGSRRSMIMRSLEAATGKLYTSVVEDFFRRRQ